MFYLCIYQKSIQKAGKHLRRGLFCKNCGITYHSLLKVKSNKGALLEIWQKVLFPALRVKRGSHDDNEGKSAFQTIVIELDKQPKKTRKERLRY